MARIHPGVQQGIALEGGRLESTDFFEGSIGELVHGSPARVWDFAAPGLISRRHMTTVAGYVTDRVSPSPQLTIDAGLRFESVTGAADTAA